MTSEIPSSVTILAAAIGAGVALLGHGLSFGRDWFSQRLKDGQQRTFVALRIAAELDYFAINCALAASDHGEPQMEQHGQEEYRSRYKTPTFTLDYSAYDWRLLPKDLLMRVLEMPHLTKQAHANLDGVSEFLAHPPYYEEFFQTRSLNFGRLGLRALQIAKDLRHRVGAVPDMPSLDPESDYDVHAELNWAVKKALEAKPADLGL